MPYNRTSRKNYRSKSYFAVPTAVFEAYKLRKISAVDLKILAYLYSLRREFSGVQVSRRRIGEICGVTEKTATASVERLYNADFVTSVVTMRKERHFRFETAVYGLKPIAKGFFLFPRSIFRRAVNLSAQTFAVLAFFCHATNFEFEKSWNSYGDICRKLGYNHKNSRSRVMNSVKILTELGFVKKRRRKAVNLSGKSPKNVFIDNIYRVSGYIGEIFKKVWFPRSIWLKMRLQRQIEQEEFRLLMRKTRILLRQKTSRRREFPAVQHAPPPITHTYSVNEFPF
jgi:predicted transcriptional regulator